MKAAINFDFRGLAALARVAGAAALACAAAHAQNVWFVAPLGTPGGGTSWASPTSLDNALASAAANDEIRVKEGFYVPAPSAPDPRAATYLINRALNVRGGFKGNEVTGKPTGSPLNTILSGEIGVPGQNDDNLYHVVTVNDPTGGKVQISGFKIEQGKASDLGGVPFPPGDSRGRGAGIHIASGSVVTLSDLLIREQSSTGQGAGVYCGSSNVTMRNMTFRHCVAYNGGAGGAIFANRSVLNAANVVFDTNGNDTVSGGAAHLNGGATQMANCVFFSNFAVAGSGGALFCQGSNVSTLWNCSFHENSAGATPTSAFTLDTTQLTTGSCRLNNCIVLNTCLSPGIGGSVHFRMGPATTASSCFLPPGGGPLPPVPAGGFANLSFPFPDSYNCSSNLSMSPATNPLLVGQEALPADFADVDYDGNVVETLPWDRERAARIPPSGVLQMGAYAAAYATLLEP